MRSRATAGSRTRQGHVPPSPAEAPTKSEAPPPGVALLVGSEALLAAWQRHASNASQVVPVLHTDMDHAIRVIDGTEVQVIIFEQAIAATESGTAVMAQIHEQRAWRDTEIRLLPRTAVSTLMAAAPGSMNPREWLLELASPLLPRPQRGAPRIRASGDEEVTINGKTVTLANWSATGVQILSREKLRPNQGVRVTLSKGSRTVRTKGVVAWCTFTMSPHPEYRAGIVLEQTIADLVEAPEDATLGFEALEYF